MHTLHAMTGEGWYAFIWRRRIERSLPRGFGRRPDRHAACPASLTGRAGAPKVRACCQCTFREAHWSQCAHTTCGMLYCTFRASRFQTRRCSTATTTGAAQREVPHCGTRSHGDPPPGCDSPELSDGRARHSALALLAVAPLRWRGTWPPGWSTAPEPTNTVSACQGVMPEALPLHTNARARAAYCLEAL